MSLTIQQIITDARKLASRLKERDTVTDTLLNETQAINKRINAMKQFQDEVEQLNDVANQKPHSQLIANIQKENRHLREIQSENRELRAAIEEYQKTLEHIMYKYRQHTTERIYRNKVNFNSMQDDQFGEIIRTQQEKINEMALVMREAALLDDARAEKDEQLVASLQTENQGLREMLQICYKYDTPPSTQTEDKNIQTEP